MTFACCTFSGKIPESKDSLIIWDRGEEICQERIFNLESSPQDMKAGRAKSLISFTITSAGIGS